MPDTLELAKAALTEHYYEPQEDGSLIRSKGTNVAGFVPRDMWLPVADKDGFLRFTRADGYWQQVPYAIAEEWAGVSGLTHLKHPECYEYVYPAEYVLNIYATALQEAS